MGKEYCAKCEDELTQARKGLQSEVADPGEELERRFAQSEDNRKSREEEIMEAEAEKLKAEEIERREAQERELASRALARRSLLHYVERRIPKYKADWVHEDIARRIEKFMLDIEAGKSPRLILQISPRIGKSELASCSGPAWILGQHPDWSIMLTSYSDELPTEWSRSIRDQLKSEEYQMLFPSGASVSRFDAGAKAWSTEQGGGVRAAGAGGSILGFGAHVAVIDDPIKGPEEADSPTTLDKQWDWATSTLYSRLAPGGGILLIQQRWSEDDLVGRFIGRMEAEKKEVAELRQVVEELKAKLDPSEEDLEAIDRYTEEADELEESMDVWDVVKYPALATGDEYLTPEGDIVSISKDEEPQDTWKLLRKTGQSIHPKRYSRSYFLKIKRNNPRRFAAMYQQSPVIDDGDYFSRSNFARRYRPHERPKLETLNVCCAWDLAIGTLQQHDHTVGLCGGMDWDGNLWLLDRKRGRWGDLEVVGDMVLDMHLRYHSAQTGIERTHLEMALAPILRRKMKERGEFISLAEGSEALKPVSDKKIRARQFQALATAGKVFVPEGDDWDEYIEWLVKFGATKVDDDVDASAWLAILLGRYELPNDPFNTRKDPEEEDWYKAFMDDYAQKVDVGGSDKAFMGR
jgi:predicted phage terminase large subunit-like protein